MSADHPRASGAQKAVQPLVQEIAAAMQALPVQNTPAMREVRRACSKKIKPWGAEQVLQLAEALHRPGLRWIGYELVRFHAGAFRSLDAEQLERMGQGIDSWESVDTFARVLSGPAWLRGQVPDDVIHAWALRELVPHDPAALRAFLREHDGALAARIKREVENKLRTGLKTPRRAGD